MTTPCARDPLLWEPPAYRSGPVKARLSGPELDRIETSVAACKTCPRLDWCATDLATWDHPSGVVAGRLFIDGHEVPVDGEHGTRAGYMRHNRAGERPCRSCMTAQRDATRARRNPA